MALSGVNAVKDMQQDTLVFRSVKLKLKLELLFLKTSQFKQFLRTTLLCHTTEAAKIKKVRRLAAYRHIFNVLTSNITLLMLTLHLSCYVAGLMLISLR